MSGQATGQRTSQSHIQLFAREEPSPVRWRLLSGNNREMGRGVEEFDSLESCLLGIKHLQSVITELDPTVQRTSSSTWVWTLAHDGAPVATSGHRYDRLIRCRQGLAHFIDELARCEIGALVVMTQSRRWMGSSPRAVAESRGRV